MGPMLLRAKGRKDISSEFGPLRFGSEQTPQSRLPYNTQATCVGCMPVSLETDKTNECCLSGAQCRTPNTEGAIISYGENMHSLRIEDNQPSQVLFLD